MEKIFASLKTPEWWFTACLVATLSSILAAYMKDWISQIGGRYSVSMRRSRWRTNRWLVRNASIVKHEPVMLVAFGIHAIALLVVTFMMVVFAMLVPVLSSALQFQDWRANPSQIFTPHERNVAGVTAWVHAGLSIFFGTSAVAFSFRARKRARLFYCAYYILLKDAVIKVKGYSRRKPVSRSK